MALQDTFVKNLKTIRKHKKMTQEKLADLCGTDTCYISQIETGRRFPSIQFIEKLAHSLDVDAGEFFTAAHTKTKEDILILKSRLLKEIECSIARVLEN